MKPSSVALILLAITAIQQLTLAAPMDKIPKENKGKAVEGSTSHKYGEDDFSSFRRPSSLDELRKMKFEHIKYEVALRYEEFKKGVGTQEAYLDARRIEQDRLNGVLDGGVPKGAEHLVHRG